MFEALAFLWITTFIMVIAVCRYEGAKCDKEMENLRGKKYL